MSIGTPVSLGSNVISSGSSIALAASAAIQSGDFVAVWVANRQGSTNVSSVSDGTNTYTKAMSFIESASAGEGEIWYKTAASAVASPTITATLSGAASLGVAIAAVRITGIATSSAIDKTATSATTSVATGTLTYPNEIILAMFINFGSPPTFTESSGFTTSFNITGGSMQNYGALCSYKIVSATTTTTYNPSQTGGGSGNGVGLATFRQGSSAGFNLAMMGM